jgi:hypothetical protein
VRIAERQHDAADLYLPEIDSGRVARCAKALEAGVANQWRIRTASPSGKVKRSPTEEFSGAVCSKRPNVVENELGATTSDTPTGNAVADRPARPASHTMTIRHGRLEFIYADARSSRRSVGPAAFSGA